MSWEDPPDTLPSRAEPARDLLLHVMRDDAEQAGAAWRKAHLLPLRSTLRAASGWLSPFGRFAER